MIKETTKKNNQTLVDNWKEKKNFLDKQKISKKLFLKT